MLITLRAAVVAASLVTAQTAAPVDTAIFAGGCFWGTEAVYEHVNGVTDVVSGFARGVKGRNEPAEAVRVIYDPSRVSYERLLEVFFLVAHDPTQVDRQGPDVGAEYRSAVFYRDEAQKRAVSTYIATLGAKHTFASPIATELAPLAAFSVAPPEHQDFAKKHPDSRYVIVNDEPKLAVLKAKYRGLWRE